MDETTTGWDDLHLFLAVAREGGLSPAARTTGRSPATLGRRMLALERSMRRELFVRHERGYELTADARDLVAELTAIEARITRLTAAPGGAERPLVKVSAGTWTTLALLERLDDFIGTPADIRLRFVSSEARLDIARREVVIGIRNARPTGDSLTGRSLSRVEFAPYAKDGAPDRWIKVMADTPSARWLDRKVGNDAVCEVNSPRNSLDLALKGKGMALLPTFIGERQSELRQVGATIPELAHDRWIVTHQDDRHLPEVRRTIDRLCRALDDRFR
ncbi:MAG: LysR family transcriptional regulator [Hoeflea sp.]|uniref:LysR family transcriptional regulator n=1 Tax=Hoeflea sp. TaxID=1940281 RepID=UPI001DD12730|nr:LysR family transcriptional regulator [Hoeflea sp.]MBU4531454.1 LysR family transcriptional regulator [Alphaproteobacteria bacterium]MBU4544311.1 LysR family transcriptional regulator [Alphaproteobacteria bacterium]MBU4550452.1 LysR family transcriptional regulator [Alphaproteobacteria bacterium]MBV1724730.1 LysR family transcriptional regulator [Hoeflea sp.]MBV1760750.1 LysR family transcriptional regulator [Hoeflea sp.]